jgi:hypothetical protein
MLFKVSKDVKETIEREVGRYLASVQYDRGSKHPKVIISTPDGKSKTVYFSRDPGQKDLLNMRSEVRSALRELGAQEREEPRRRPRLGVLGEKLLETVEPPAPSFFDPQPRPVLTLQPKKEPEPMNNVTPIKAATPEPVVEEAKALQYTKLSQSEVVQVARLLMTNGTVDEAARTFTYNDGWSDQRIFEILSAVPGREVLKVSHITGLRRRDFGDTAEERVRKDAQTSPPDPARFGPRLSSVESRLDRLERELGLKS